MCVHVCACVCVRGRVREKGARQKKPALSPLSRCAGQKPRRAALFATFFCCLSRARLTPSSLGRRCGPRRPARGFQPSRRRRASAPRSSSGASPFPTCPTPRRSPRVGDTARSEKNPFWARIMFLKPQGSSMTFMMMDARYVECEAQSLLLLPCLLIVPSPFSRQQTRSRAR